MASTHLTLIPSNPQSTIMQSSIVLVCAVAVVFVQQISTTCTIMAPNVLKSSLKNGSTGPDLGLGCPSGGVCFNLDGTDQCFECKDTSINCASWNTNGICASSFYTEQYKKSYCPKTCGYCTGVAK
ncbi:unnamed protein product, partial [Mesorhabditis belari]|uniref:ShKT domain-containing protein n=1 Tax=Mesorhabditis belari TaxID=2138241 RepID=A0AAF3EVU5_9BILA